MEFSGTTFVISKTYKKHNIVLSINEQQMLSKLKKKKQKKNLYKAMKVKHLWTCLH